MGLDALRGLAALGVVFYHYTSNFDRVWGHSPDFSWRFPFGAWGVPIFFVISGFVVFMSLAQSRSVLDFGVKRFCRLYPPYWTALIVTFLVVRIFGLPGREVSIGTAIANIAMFHGAFGVENVDNVYWTLHVELCFYFLMAAIFLTKQQRHLVPCLLALAAIGVLNTQNGWFSDWTGMWRLERAYPLRNFLPYFLFGILLYRIHFSGYSHRQLVCVIPCLLLMALQGGAIKALVVAMITAGVTLLNPSWLSHPLFLYFGTISYSLYLLHASIGYVIIRAAYQHGFSGEVGIVFAFLIVVALASLNAILVEKPANHWLRAKWKKMSCVRRSAVFPESNPKS